MGDVSNLGFDNFSHKEYLSGKGDVKNAFQKNVDNLLRNYDGGNLNGYEVIAEGTAEIHPDYQNWVKVGESYLGK